MRGSPGLARSMLIEPMDIERVRSLIGPSHFMATGWCQSSQRFFCANCATETQEVVGWNASLDRLEYDGGHPGQGQRADHVLRAASQEPHLVRYPLPDVQWRPQREFSDAEVQANWNNNAEKWNAAYDDGDRNRRYQSDEPMIRLLGEVEGSRVLFFRVLKPGGAYLRRIHRVSKIALRGAPTCTFTEDRTWANGAARSCPQLPPSFAGLLGGVSTNGLRDRRL